MPKKSNTRESTLKLSVEFEIRHLRAESLGVEGEDQTVGTPEQDRDASKSC